jgi:acetyl-CoA synthetase
MSARAENHALLESHSLEELSRSFEWSQLWDLFDGDRDHLNIATECLDRHVDRGVAVRLVDGSTGFQELTFEELAAWSSRFAHFLDERGVVRGEPVAVMVEPSLAFYAALFGAIKQGAAAVPLFTLFGPEAIRARAHDCGAKLLVVDIERAATARATGGCEVVELDADFLRRLEGYPTEYTSTTSASDLAVLQYTSGTSRNLPDAVHHSHRAIVTLMLAARFGLGLHRDDRYFCPSSPAWGHGLWHGTIAPWGLGIATGVYAGRFDAGHLVKGLRHFEITNLAAAGTVYRMFRRDDLIGELPPLTKASYTGEALDAVNLEVLRERLGTPICGMYGTTETGVILANFPGFEDYEVKPGALGKPLPGWDVGVIDQDDTPTETDVAGEIAVRRNGAWMRSKDLGRIDADGYFWYLGRADDIIISAGWTISPIEVEAVLSTHADVDEVAIIGVADELRGHVLKAFVVSGRRDDDFAAELKTLVRTELSPHEYPRHVEFVAELPKTTNGKINRRALRSAEAAA